MFHRRLDILTGLVNVLSFPLPASLGESGISDDSSHSHKHKRQLTRCAQFHSLLFPSSHPSPVSSLTSFLPHVPCFAHYSHFEITMEIMGRVINIYKFFLAKFPKIATCIKKACLWLFQYLTIHFILLSVLLLLSKIIPTTM